MVTFYCGTVLHILAEYVAVQLKDVNTPEVQTTATIDVFLSQIEPEATKKGESLNAKVNIKSVLLGGEKVFSLNHTNHIRLFNPK